MFESIRRFTTRMVNKATYDPKLDEALLKEKQAQSLVRGTFREVLSKAEQNADNAYFEKRVTAVAYTELKTNIQDNYNWLDGNQDATALEITEKIDVFRNAITKILVADKPRQFFSNTLVLFGVTFNLDYTQNKISEEKYKSVKTEIDKERAFVKKNPNETLEQYVARIDAFIEKYPDQESMLRSNKNTAIEIQKSAYAFSLEAPTSKSNAPTPNDLEKKKEQLDKDSKKKELLEAETFNLKRVLWKIVKYSLIAVLVTLLICYILYCGSLAANYSIVRPVEIRILFFFFGMLAWLPVALYFNLYVSGYQRKTLFYNSGAFLLPLFEYDPTKEVKNSLERFIWFPTTPSLERAREDYLRGLEKVIS